MRGLGWIAVTFSLLGEIIMGSGVGKQYVIPAYILYLLGNVVWVIYARQSKIKELLVLNIIYFLLSVRIIIKYSL